MNTKENKDEVRAKKYLHSLDFVEVEHEPLGNVTPDFLLDKKVAVEVRRLNRNHIDGDKIINIENLEIPIVKNIKKVIDNFKFDSFSNSVYVSIVFLKAIKIQSKKSIIKKIIKLLKKHTHNINKIKTYKISKYLEMTLTPTDKKSNIYIYTGCNGDSFWLLHELHKNIQSVIEEKNKKIEKNFNLYNEWWLVLVDSIIYGLDNEDFLELKKIKLKKRKFTKVIILSPKGEFKVLEF